MASSIEDSSSSFSEQFQQIRHLFVSGLARREAEIGQAESSEDLYAALHRLAGAAGSFGFDDLTQLTREAMESSRQNNEENLRIDIARLQQAIQAIRAAG